MLSSGVLMATHKAIRLLYGRGLKKGKLIFCYFCKRGDGTKEKRKQQVNKAASGTERRWVSFQKGKHQTMKWNHLGLSFNSRPYKHHTVWLPDTHSAHTTPTNYFHHTVRAAICWRWKGADTLIHAIGDKGSNDACWPSWIKVNIVLLIPDKAGCVQPSARSHNPLHRTNLKVKHWGRACEGKASCTCAPLYTGRCNELYYHHVSLYLINTGLTSQHKMNSAVCRLFG